MVLGDVHGNSDWLAFYVYPTAMALGVDRIIQVGDFGYWEHQPDGVRFLDDVSTLAQASGIPWYWLRGNHDKVSLLFDKYQERDGEGFFKLRPGLGFIPDGLIWNWDGASFRAFGGAYSVDKSWRVKQEQNHYEVRLRKEKYRALAAGRAPEPVAPMTGTLWFPEEEMTDVDMDKLLGIDASPIDFVFSHDKPRCTNPGWNRKDLPLCLPNQDRLQRALRAHTPAYWFHGHLHHYYVQQVDSGDHQRTTVVSLAPDDDAAEMGWRREDTWCLIELTDYGQAVILGREISPAIDPEHVEAARSVLQNA